MKKTFTPKLIYIFVLLAYSTQMIAQSAAYGLIPFNTYAGPPDNINVGRLDLGIHLDIPLITLKGRGQTDTTFSLQYNSPNWYIDDYGVDYPRGTTSVEYGGTLGWSTVLHTPVKLSGIPLDGNEQDSPCYQYNGLYRSFGPWTYTDVNGFKHTANITGEDDTQCGGGISGDTSPHSADGYTIQATGGDATVTDISGVIANAGAAENLGDPFPFPFGGTILGYQDTNGNKISLYGEGTNQNIYTSGPPFTLRGTLSTSAGTYFNIQESWEYGPYIRSGDGQAESSYYPYALSISYTNSNGQASTVSVVFANFTIQTNFGVPNAQEYGPLTIQLPQSVIYPDGSFYQFSYEQTPGYPGSVTGRLSQVRLPSGGTISYQYGGAFNPSTTSQPFTLTRTTPDGTTNYSEVLNLNIDAQGDESNTTTVTDAQLNDTVIQFTGQSYQGAVEVKRTVYQGSQPPNNAIMTVTHCYAETPTIPCSGTGIFSDPPPHVTTVQTTPQSGSTSTVVTQYNQAGLVGEVDEYDYGAASPTRKTVTTYATLGTVNNRPDEVKIYDANGTLAKWTKYSYDATTGNQTDIDEHIDSSTTTPTSHTHISYTSAGMVNSVTDANQSLLTQYQYDATEAFLQSISSVNTNQSNINNVGHVRNFVYDDNTGLLLSSTDLNNNKTSYTYDSVGRLVYTSYPDGGKVSSCYNVLTQTGNSTSNGCTNSTANSVLTTTALSSSVNRQQETDYDGMGRVSKTILFAPEGRIVTDTGYDSLGRTAYISNPYRSNSDPTYGITSYSYDPLGRMTMKCDPDNGTGTSCTAGPSYQQWTFTGNSIFFRDERANTWTRVYDALGHLTSVTGPDGLQASYQYDANDNLTSASTGAQNRKFTYDFLSHLITATNPESGTICYGVWDGSNCTNGYDSDGNLLRKTDARGVVISYSYDALSRLTAKAYSNDPAGTLSSCYQFDLRGDGTAGGNSIGRLTFSWTQKGTCAGSVPGSGAITRHAIIAYDDMGRIINEQQCHLQNCVNGHPYNTRTAYNYVGQQTGYSSAVQFIDFMSYYDSAGRLQSIGSSVADETHPATLYSVSSYSPAGAVQVLQMGTGLTVTKSYDNRTRITSEQVTGQR